MAKRFITPFAEVGDRAAVSDTPTGTDVNYQTGYPAEYEADPLIDPAAKFVERDKNNQIYNDITANIKEWQEHVYPSFIEAVDNGGVAFPYKKGSIVTYLSIDYISSVDSNATVPPSSSWLVYADSGRVFYPSYQDMINNTDQRISTVDQYVSSGVGIWITTTALTDSVISNTAPQLYVKPLNGIWFDDFGADNTLNADNTALLNLFWSVSPWGSTLNYGHGHYRFDDGVTHPLKQLYHKGQGRAFSVAPIPANANTGTALVFKGTTGDATGGVYMPPPNGLELSRFSSFSDLSFFGNGVNDDNGTNTLLKINNLGTDIANVDFRYGAIGIETNYSVGARWSHITSNGSSYAFLFRYDPLFPFLSPSNGAAVTQNNFSNIAANTSIINTTATGWRVDATCEYGGNNHQVWDMEACYVGAIIDGRIASKDHDGVQAFGAAAWQSSGNTFDSIWFERNVSSNLVLSFDQTPNSEGEPKLLIGTIYQDVNKVVGSINTLVNNSSGVTALSALASERSQGTSGSLNNPLTAGQYLLNGPEINTPHKRSILDSRIPSQLANRPAFNTNSSFEFDVFISNMPLIGANINVANVTLGNDTQSATIEVSMVGTGNGGRHACSFSKILVENSGDTITSVIVTEDSNDSFIPLTLQASRTGINTFGILVWKDALLTQVTYATCSFKVVIGGSSGGGNQANLSILL